MQILLTHGYFLSEDAREMELMRPYVPLGILCVAAFLEKAGYKTDVYDSTFENWENFQQHVLDTRPEVIGIYTNLMTKINVLKMIRFVKSTSQLAHAKIVLGGPEVRHHASKFLKHGCDFVVVGEGEETMLELVEFLSGKAEGELAKITGLGYVSESGEVCINAERPKIRDIDALPIPARGKVKLEKYFDAWKKKHGTSAASISTMRGCPYTCKWCSRSVYGLSYRRRAAKLVVDEIELLCNTYSMDSFWFVDDVFTISHKWLDEFCDELERRNISIKYECITRADRMSAEVIRNLKRSGCFRVWIGAESGSQEVLDLMDRRVQAEGVRDMIRESQKQGILAGTFIMVGYPGETEKDIFATVAHLKSSNPDYFTITVAYPITGTEMHKEIEGKLISKLQWETSTDRDVDFQRSYARRYYDFAVRYIVNEVNAFKAMKNREIFSIPKYKLKSIIARGAMMLSK